MEGSTTASAAFASSGSPDSLDEIAAILATGFLELMRVQARTGNNLENLSKSLATSLDDSPEIELTVHTGLQDDLPSEEQ